MNFNHPHRVGITKRDDAMVWFQISCSVWKSAIFHNEKHQCFLCVRPWTMNVDTHASATIAKFLGKAWNNSLVAWPWKYEYFKPDTRMTSWARQGQDFIRNENMQIIDRNPVSKEFFHWRHIIPTVSHSGCRLHLLSLSLSLSPFLCIAIAL